MSKGRGILFIISGPSGVGKGTVLKKVCENAGDISVSVSVTTRKPRDGEIDGVHYNFISKNEFDELVKSDGMYEYVEALGCGYGTPKKSVNEKLSRGEDVILEIETIGAAKIRKKFECVSIFIAPPNVEELKRRLIKRQTETPEQIQRRLAKCMTELPCAREYDYIVVNNELETCIKEVNSIIVAERCKVSKNLENINKILENNQF